MMNRTELEMNEELELVTGGEEPDIITLSLVLESSPCRSALEFIYDNIGFSNIFIWLTTGYTTKYAGEKIEHDKVREYLEERDKKSKK